MSIATEPALRPYYQDDRCTIYHGDCREILPQLGRFDLVLTDPPYGMNVNTDNSRFSGKNGNYSKRLGNGKGTANGQPVIGDKIPLAGVPIELLLSKAPKAIVWGLNHFPELLHSGGALVWIKKYDEAYGTFLSDAEIAWTSFNKGTFCRRDLSNNAIASERVHPTQKPLGLMRWCLTFAPDANSVLDPFMGSGTSILAGYLDGRHVTGIEIDEQYCEIAADRLRQGVLF